MSQKKSTKRNVSGWLILDKPYDVASTEAVGKVRWLFNAKKGGHAGTLDPLATGILPIALGEATKTVPFVQDGEKIYHFTLEWGRATTTDDAEGETTETSDVRPTEAAVRAMLLAFIGEIEQIPPAFSAIKIKGERAYDLARSGQDVEMPARTIIIDRFELIEHGQTQSVFEVECAKGTYVRALARDLARRLGSCGHVAALHRAAVGPFSDADAVSLAALEEAPLAHRDDMLLPVNAGLADVAEIALDPQQTNAVRNGNPALLTGAGAPIHVADAWASHKGQAVATGFVEKGQFKPRRVILG